MNINDLVGMSGALAVALAGTAQAIQNDADGFKAGSDNTIPTGARSIAAGWFNTAIDGSLAIGEYNEVNIAGLASGHGNILDANTYFSAGIGVYNALAYSENSVALGDYNALGVQIGSVALGGSNRADFPMGKSGINNVLIGYLNKIDGMSASAPNNLQGTVLIGVDNKSVSTMAWAMGKGNIAQTETVTLGTYAAEVSNASLIVGNGSSTSARSNGLVVMRNGTVSVPGGNLLLGSLPAMTSTGVGSYLSSNGYLNSSNASTYLGNYLPANGYFKKASGNNATVSGDAILSLGTNSIASGDYAFVIGGFNSSATGDNSMALGQYASASDLSSVAIGSFSNAVGAELGENLALNGGSANGSYSLATSYGTATGEISVAMASGLASGDGAVAIGGYDWVQANWPGNNASGENSASVGGIGNQAMGFSSYAGGYWTKARASHSVALGSLNLGSSGNQTVWVETDSLFELGNGTSARSSIEPTSTVRSNAITTLKNGRTTLTNKAWSAAVAANAEAALVDPAPTTDSGGEALVVDGHTRLRGKVVIEQPQGDISMGIYGN